MAIIDKLPGLKVTIESQGQQLPEYADTSEFFDPNYSTKPHKRTSVYAECVSNNSFRVAFSIEPPFKLPETSLLFQLSVDGQVVGGSTARSLPDGHFRSSIAEVSTRVSADQVSYQALKFASICKVDDADSSRVKNDAAVASSGLGDIVVRVYRTSTKPRNPSSFKGPDKPLNAAPAEIAEKALKGRALSHGVGFGEGRLERNAHRPSKTSTVYIDGRKNPYAVFKFKYRSRGALQQEMIIPRSESPDLVMGPLSPRNDNVDNPTLTREERLTQLKKEIDLIKAEVKDENVEESIRGKKRSHDDSTMGVRAYKSSRNSEGLEVVDLSED